MTLTAWRFALTRLEGRAVIGQAVVCPDARYCSVAWAGVAYLDRRPVTPSEWRGIVGEFEGGAPTAPLPATSPIVQVLTRGIDAGMAVQHTATLAVAGAHRPEHVATALDALLRGASSPKGDSQA